MESIENAFKGFVSYFESEGKIREVRCLLSAAFN